ncbi:cytochrome P450 [Thermoflavimicrobium daqui]|uniref:Cytochrome P450 n=1 Tax=Thermoflavimicrobium daqui TaxID=2137476 RepID=A0A364K542_9BACL|nr:cytochrome P450 [Thermoflavimicrobium daqui]RAL24447.1 cytochrome P450 [Thermoflavimicrobium daqui]
MNKSYFMDSSHINLEEVDLTDPYLYSNGNPHLIWHAMRNRAPIHWQTVREGLGFWSLTKYNDAVKVLKDHERFTSERGTLLNLLGTNDPAGGRQLAATDPPRHTQMRRPLQQAFNTKALEKHIESIRSEVYKVLQPAVGGELFDFAAASTYLSTSVAGILLNLPSEDWPMLTQLTSMAVAPSDSEYELQDGSKATLERAHREIFAYFQDIIQQRQRTPGDDPISILLSLEVDGQRMNPGAVISNCYSLLLGATVTTPHVSSSALLELMKSGGYEEWAAHPEHLTSGVEEAIRWSSPASHFMRYATQDVEIRDTKIKEGEAVVVWLGSANRDEDIFQDPYKFNFRRNPNPHISFGSGHHHCLGHTAARLSLGILFKALLENFESFELKGDVEYLSSNFISGIKHLPVIGHIRSGAEKHFRI